MRYLLTLAIAAVMLLSFGAVASAEETEPEPCVPGVEVYTATNDASNDLYEITRTTTCPEDGSTVITYESVLLAKWVQTSSGGFYVDADDWDDWLSRPWFPRTRR